MGPFRRCPGRERGRRHSQHRDVGGTAGTGGGGDTASTGGTAAPGISEACSGEGALARGQAASPTGPSPQCHTVLGVTSVSAQGREQE